MATVTSVRNHGYLIQRNDTTQLIYKAESNSLTRRSLTAFGLSRYTGQTRYQLPTRRRQPNDAGRTVVARVRDDEHPPACVARLAQVRDALVPALRVHPIMFAVCTRYPSL
jgi:hypothetical protein